jgi:capsid assembly protease
MMDTLNKRVEFLCRSPFWAILPSAMGTIVMQLLKPVAYRSEWECSKPYTLGTGKKNKVSVIPVQGVLSKDGPSWMGTQYDTISESAERAASDKDIRGIVLAVDSPGGEVTGLPETARVLAQVNKVKPVSAIVEGMAASAGYWLTSQANDITLTPSGEVGSVGVRMMHTDLSKMLDSAGIKITELYSGEYKTEWSPFSPLTDGAKADMQPRLEAIHNDFISAVAEGRGVRATADTRGSRFGEGRMLSAKEAASAGLVDRIESTRNFYRAITPAEEEHVPQQFPTFPAAQDRRARLNLEKSRQHLQRSRS